MGAAANDSLWTNAVFRRLFASHATSLVGSGLGAVALGLLAHELVGANAPEVLGIALTIRIGVIVLLSPWAGLLAARWGTRRSLIAFDLLRVVVVLGFLFAQNVGQIYVLAFLLNAGSAIFTPIYKAAIPGVVSTQVYPRALAWGTVAYDASNILAPALAGLVIVLFGFEGNFLLNAVAFAVSAWLLFRLPRHSLRGGELAQSSRAPAWAGMAAMLGRWPLRLTLLLALQASIAGAFVLVGTIGKVKGEMQLGDTSYAWLMATYGAGSVAGAFAYAKMLSLRPLLRRWIAASLVGALALLALDPGYGWLFPALATLGAGQAILGIWGNEILARSTGTNERASIFSAHFALSHLGWGIFYPLAGGLVARSGYEIAAGLFAGILLMVSLPVWIYQIWIWRTHRHLPNHDHGHTHQDDGDLTHPHRHGPVEHRHFHFHY